MGPPMSSRVRVSTGLWLTALIAAHGTSWWLAVSAVCSSAALILLRDEGTTW